MIFDWILVLIILGGVIFSVWFAFEYGDFLYLPFGFMMTFLVFIFAALIGGGASYNLPHTYKHTNVDIIALQDGNSVNGKFFLGSGYLNGEPTYTFYTSENGGAKLSNQPAENVIVYQDTNKPYAVRETECVSDFKWLVDCPSSDDIVELHIPKGTIKSNYVLDAK